MGLENRQDSGSFILTARQWIGKTNARGIKAKPGRFGGTFALKDIAFEFASWIPVEFKLCLIREFQRLKDEEHETAGLGCPA
ncbi:KilA-N domain-containing protein [Methanoregula sp.]|uniref:KilA-N domain-containing protein n=1 Tax=Methanoregula sp. TaxID=2052170 RepID=UPI003564B6CF